MNDFVYEYPVKVYFGAGSASKAISEELAQYGPNVLLAYGGGSIRKTGIYDEITGLLRAAGKNITEFSGIMANPTYAKVQEGAELARKNHIDFILAVGGGSVIDCCKIVAAQARMEGDIWEAQYGRGEIPEQMLPTGAVVTAFGTGAEMNNGAVITNEERLMKAPLAGAYHSFAVLDPEYTMSMPEKQVISGAFDTLSHCMETYFGTPREDNVSDEINEAIMRNVIRNIRRTLKEPGNEHIRSELIWDAAMAENGILKLGKTTDFQSHMLEHQLGAYTNCNHGQGLAVIHPVLYRHICKDAPEQFARFAENVFRIDPEGKTVEETARAGIEALADFIREIGLPGSFREMNIGADTDFRAVADTTMLTGGCCRRLTADELYEILRECI